MDCKGVKDSSRVMKIFRNLIVAMVSPVHTLAKLVKLYTLNGLFIAHKIIPQESILRCTVTQITSLDHLKESLT